MSEPIVLESNQNHATITSNGICPTLSCSMGMGGGYIPMIVRMDDARNNKFRSLSLYNRTEQDDATKGKGL